jgi:hypothetical protein
MLNEHNLAIVSTVRFKIGMMKSIRTNPISNLDRHLDLHPLFRFALLAFFQALNLQRQRI